MATNIEFESKFSGAVFFRVLSPVKGNFWVKSFKEGTAIIHPGIGSDILDFAKIIEGSFRVDSNVQKELNNSFECKEEMVLEAIRFEFNGVTVEVNSNNADARTIFKLWKKKGDEDRREVLFRQFSGNARVTEIRRIEETTDMQFKNKEAEEMWDEIVENNSSNFITDFACCWAKYMQKFISEGKTVAEIAEQTSSECDFEGITGFMKACAIQILIQCWRYGDELQKYYG
jgi:hypothetical protein